MSFDAAPVLARLKPFQRATVEHVFERLFGTDDPTDRFLVADEVGLGKTMIARGVVAKLLERSAASSPHVASTSSTSARTVPSRSRTTRRSRSSAATDRR